jgi:hypothetical protein
MLAKIVAAAYPWHPPQSSCSSAGAFLQPQKLPLPTQSLSETATVRFEQLGEQQGMVIGGQQLNSRHDIFLKLKLNAEALKSSSPTSMTFTTVSRSEVSGLFALGVN